MHESLLALLILCLALPAGATEEDFGEGLVIEFPEGNRALAERAAGLYPGLEARVEACLGRPVSRPIQIVLCRNRAEFVAASGTENGPPRWALAFADSSRNLIAIRIGGLEPYRNNFQSTLLHEMVHLALGSVENRAAKRLPRWFHEGVAEWASGSLHLGADDDLTLAAVGDRLLPFAGLTDSFPDEAREASLAYLQSRSFVEFLVENRPAGVVERILDRFESQEEFEAAFAGEVRRDLPAAEALWRRRVTPRRPLLWLVLRSLSLFSALALIVFLAYLWRRRRDHWILGEMEEEEEFYP